MPTEVEQYRTLVRRLLKKTRAKEISWDDGWTGDLECEFASYKIRLSSEEGPEGSPLEVVQILNSSNQIIDAFNDEDISDDSHPMGFPNYWKLMQELHKIANRQAKGADAALKNILDVLDDNDDL
ncbi:MAG TPA: hypothetical protein VFQ67_11720 [Allosphingosinicella sp.]|jgi:hypothetical protein|nr:hypothetical protein [Allosphingosinicella sp.]